MAKLLVLDDDLLFCEALSSTLEAQGHSVLVAHTLARARDLLKKQSFSVIFIDVYLPDGNGIDLLSGLSLLPEVPEAIVVTAQGNPEGAETAITAGAWDYVQKPAHMGEIVLMVERALEAHERKRQMPDFAGASGIVGTSRPMRLTLLQIFEAAQSDGPVLISGETGTGKELLARAIHKNSRRAGGPFVVVDCGAIAPTLLESELFGNVRGAFTGAVHSRQGLVMLANQGVLFLDEVGELALEHQKAFLRLIQERKFRPIGGAEEVQSDFRVVAATNRNLAEMAAGGTFRTDLLFRLQGMSIQVSPLRSRNEDIITLAQYACTRAITQYGMQHKTLSQEALEALASYTWPGNVRELLHTVEAGVLAAGEQPLILLQHLPVHLRAHAARSRVSRRKHRPWPEETKTETFGRESAAEKHARAPLPATDGSAFDASREEAEALRPSGTGSDFGSENAGGPTGLGTRGFSPLFDEQSDGMPEFLAVSPREPEQLPRLAEAICSGTWREFQETVLYEQKRRYLLALLQRARGNVPAAARLAGLSRQRFYILLREHGIARQWE